MRRKLRLYSLFLFAGLVTAVLLPFQLIALRLHTPTAQRIPVLWHKAVGWAIGIRVNRFGVPSTEKPLLLVSNHVSWADIIVLGSLFPVSFIAKKEVADIPGASLLARLQRTIFVDREQKRQSIQQSRTVAQRIASGDVIVLFAEGTTGNGNRLLAFNSSLFGAAQIAINEGAAQRVYVQPVSIRYTRLHGLPIGRRGRAEAAWPGDVELAPHLSDFVTAGPWDVDVRLAQPVAFEENTRRRHISAKAHEEIRSMLALSLRN